MGSVARARFDGGLDRLSSLIERFRVTAVIAPGGISQVPTANFFVFRNGAETRRLVFVPKRSATDPCCRAEMRGEGEVADVSAYIGISGAGDHLVEALPDCISVPLADAPYLEAVVIPLVEEVTDPRCGGQAVFHRLCEVVVIRLLRHALESGAANVGLLAGLAHPRLASVLVALHEEPDGQWTLEKMAEIGGMSRTQFALTFKEVVGTTPGVYLSNWRLEIARAELEAGSPVKIVARMCGFSSAAAFSRAFSRRFGHAPKLERRKVA